MQSKDDSPDAASKPSVPVHPPSISTIQPSQPFFKQSALCLDGKINGRSKHVMACGGYADIWKGSLGSQAVAIKVMRGFSSLGAPIQRTKLLKRLWREYLAWSRLSHPNILECLGFSYDFTPESEYEVPSLISGWMDNGTILAYIERYPDTNRLNLVLGVAKGLEYLHNRNPAIVHGDLRGGNILVSDVGVPCLTDFGLSRILSETREMTTSSEVAGSLRWMSRELLHGNKVSEDSDVWAFGMTLLEIYSGKRPYAECSVDPEVMRRISEGITPSRPVHDDGSFVLADNLWVVCQQSWNIHPTERPSMRVVTRDLAGSNDPQGFPQGADSGAVLDEESDNVWMHGDVLSPSEHKNSDSQTNDKESLPPYFRGENLRIGRTPLQLQSALSTRQLSSWSGVIQPHLPMPSSRLSDMGLGLRLRLVDHSSPMASGSGSLWFSGAPSPSEDDRSLSPHLADLFCLGYGDPPPHSESATSLHANLIKKSQDTGPTFSVIVQDVLPVNGSHHAVDAKVDRLLPTATLEHVTEAVKELGYIVTRKFKIDTAIIVVLDVDAVLPRYDASSANGLVITGSQTPADWFIEYLKFHNIRDHPMFPDRENTEATLSNGKVDLLDGPGSISFSRAFRVPDDGKSYALPPYLGDFPLLPIKPFSKNLPASITKREGFFFPMYQREALWIELPYCLERTGAFKVSVGGINAVSGLPNDHIPNLDFGEKQDYLVAGAQRWLDGIATEPGTVRQFVSMPLGQGYTIEEQALGTIHGGIQIDFYPRLDRYVIFYRLSAGARSSDRLSFHDPIETQLKDGASLRIQLGRYPRQFKLWDTIGERYSRVGPEPLLPVYNPVPLLIRTLFGTRFSVEVDQDDTIQVLKDTISESQRLGVDQLYLSFVGKELEDGRTLRDYGIGPDACIYMVLRLKGGGDDGSSRMGIAVGGQIRQKIYADSPANFASYSRRPLQRIFVYPVSTPLWELATGTLAPPTLISRIRYKGNKIPWFDVYDEHIAGVSRGGMFQDIQSIDGMDHQTDPGKRGSLTSTSVTGDHQELDATHPPLCDLCEVIVACVVFRPCTHCACSTCFSKTALGGSTCLKCSERIVNYVGFVTPARNIISSDDPGFKITDIFIDAPVAKDFNDSRVITLHLPEDEPISPWFGNMAIQDPRSSETPVQASDRD